MKILLFMVAGLLPVVAMAQSVLRISEDITLTQVSPHAWVHTSVADLEGFPGVSSNGMLVVSRGEVLMLDTPANDDQTERLVRFIEDSMHARVTMFMPNHWHADCMGGLAYLQSFGVVSYANRMTIAAALANGKPVPEHGFHRSMKLTVGDIRVYLNYEGGGHTPDNTVVWIPEEGVLFGGCLVKDLGTRGIGNGTDADMEAWPATMDRLIRKYENAKVVVPGHGLWGGTELLSHTLELVSPEPGATR